MHNNTLPSIAFLGIGLMGLPMATRLIQAGYTLQVWNRTASKTAPLVALGATAHETPTTAVQHADIVIAILENGSINHHVLTELGVAKAMRAGSLFVDMASIQPSEARSHAALLEANGVRVLDAPVSGGTVGAEAGTLAIMVGGLEADFLGAKPVFEVLGRATHVGPCGSGQLAKLVNQMIVGITIGAVAEGLLLAEKGGADPAKVREAIGGGFAESRILQVHGERMIEHDFAPRGRVSVQLKDMRNALSTAQELSFHSPITGFLEQLYAQAASHGFADLDHSALFLELARLNHMQASADNTSIKRT